VPVTGRATLNGKPVARAFITLFPVTEDGYGEAGFSDATGEFKVHNVGLYPGTYAVTVCGSAIPKKFDKPETSPLKVDVTQWGENHFQFDLETE
jgi:hypothetical protein